MISNLFLPVSRRFGIDPLSKWLLKILPDFSLKEWVLSSDDCWFIKPSGSDGCGRGLGILMEK